MAVRWRGFRLVTVLWALALGTGVVALAGSMLLPSTKRGRVDLDELRRLHAEGLAAADAAATRPSTAPATAPATSPVDPTAEQ